MSSQYFTSFYHSFRPGERKTNRQCKLLWLNRSMLNNPHRRFNPLTHEWVLVSPHRAKRPWLGQVEKLSPEQLPAYDPTCYLCPRNERAGGVFNPDYENAYVFENDFAALLPHPESEANLESDHPLLIAVPEQGQCYVVCFSARHDLTLPELELPGPELEPLSSPPPPSPPPPTSRPSGVWISEPGPEMVTHGSVARSLSPPLRKVRLTGTASTLVAATSP